jgi:2-dehydro-3-deoxyphosphogluconate aldolase/(4S)-4-hydroxy-2-oxoglutarate aldolase
MKNFIDTINKYGAVPFIMLHDERTAIKVAEALLMGGIPIAEVTFRTECGVAVIKRIKKEYPNMLVGAGTVITLKQAEQAANAGADFIVTPGLSHPILKFCIKESISIIPGLTTAMELQMGIEEGLNLFKFFPAKQSGGADAILELSGPYPEVRFMPSGGLTFDDVEEYFRCKCVAAVCGDFMVTQELIDLERWDIVTWNCKYLRSLAIGLNFEGFIGPGNDDVISPLLNGLLRFSPCAKLEKIVLPSKGFSLVFKVNSISRAKAYFEDFGINAFVCGDGEVIRITNEVSGDKVFLMQ